MHRNTYLLVIFLAVFAALVVGVNIGRKTASPTGEKQPPPKTTPVKLAVPTISLNTFTSISCGITFRYPDTLTKLEATGSAIFIDNTAKNQALAVTCQKDIPRPPLTEDMIETRMVTNPAGVSSVSAKLYHDASAKDGAPIDELIFRHPKTGMDVFIAGYGETFNQIISTLTLLP